MKNKFMRIYMKLGAFIFALLFLVVCLGCDDPELRPGPSFDGSIHWALQIAQPEITNFAADAQIYSILGAMIWKDGRLPGNTGSWSFISWSSNLQKTCQVTVNYLGNPSTSIRESENPPTTGSGSILPAGWVNSTTIFASIPTSEITKNFAQLLVFNKNSYPQDPNTAVWGINFDGGKNPLVRWDGHYIGTQFD